MRIFKNKWFSHWAQKEKISDDILIKTAKEVDSGAVEANLGGFLFKKRLSKPGAGKSGGYRVLIAYKNDDRTIFLFAFAKGQRSNISDKEKAALKIIAKDFMAATQKQLKAMIDEGSIWEVKND